MSVFDHFRPFLRLISLGTKHIFLHFRGIKWRENAIFRVYLIYLLNKLRVLIFASFSLDLEFS